ncbi:hypothetical protein FQR65_LT13522 [Abscondita terminalis]|nr:hypothetical protein FQR65_LT13522 [Abscondita terminalis]
MVIIKVVAFITVIILCSEIGVSEVTHNKETMVTSSSQNKKSQTAFLTDTSSVFQYILYVVACIIILLFFCITICILGCYIIYAVIQMYRKIKGSICKEGVQEEIPEEMQLQISVL